MPVTDEGQRQNLLRFMQPGVMYSVGNFVYHMELDYEFVEAALLDLKDEGKVTELIPFYRHAKMPRVYYILKEEK